MSSTSTNQHDLEQRLNVAIACFSLWLGVTFTMVSSAYYIDRLAKGAIPLTLIVPIVVAPGLALAIYIVWLRTRIGDTSGAWQNEFAAYLTHRARRWSFLSVNLTALVLIAAIANFGFGNTFGPLFHLSILMAAMFASYGAAFLGLFLSSDWQPAK